MRISNPQIIALSFCFIAVTTSIAHGQNKKVIVKASSKQSENKSRDTPLSDVTWALIEAQGSKQPVHLELRSLNKSISGTTVCNPLFGNYRSEGPQKVFFGNLATTNQSCHSSTEERLYLKALKEVRGYRINGNQLELLDQAGQLLLKYQAEAMVMNSSAPQLPTLTIPTGDNVGAISLDH